MRLKRDTKDVIESTILLILGCAEQSAVIFAFLLHGVSVPLLFGEQCAVLVLLERSVKKGCRSETLSGQLSFLMPR